MCPDFEQLCPTRRPLTRSYRRLIVWIAAAEFGTEPSVVGGSRLNCWPFALHVFRSTTGRYGDLFLYSKSVSARTHAQSPAPSEPRSWASPPSCSSWRAAFASLVSSRRRPDRAQEVCARRWALAEDAARDLGRALIVSSAAARAPLGWALTPPRRARRHVHDGLPPHPHPHPHPPPPLPP